ncbi:hypothetical protein U9M48_020622 [Paspalum notatum var. saurae]|uniref:Uncharacterized protein n=1 Tax=Paspalum notatum var. saurae TaxID=547442 RepID=A0AAQ3WSW3_PASNO
MPLYPPALRPLPGSPSLPAACLPASAPRLPLHLRGPRIDMDTSSPAALVNADIMGMFVGRRVRTVVQVQRSEGGVVVGHSGCPPTGIS